MPIRRRVQRAASPTKVELAKRLHNEWTKPKKNGQPIIIVEGDENEPIHIYVIWDRWGEQDQTERSEIIMDVVDNLVGEDRLPVDSPVTVAMGLTKQEAKRLGIEWK